MDIEKEEIAAATNMVAPTKGFTNDRKEAILRLASDDQAMLQEYGHVNIFNMGDNAFVTAVCAFTVIGALCFGIDQGTIPASVRHAMHR